MGELNEKIGNLALTILEPTGATKKILEDMGIPPGLATTLAGILTTGTLSIPGISLPKLPGEPRLGSNASKYTSIARRIGNYLESGSFHARKTLEHIKQFGDKGYMRMGAQIGRMSSHVQKGFAVVMLVEAALSTYCANKCYSQ